METQTFMLNLLTLKFGQLMEIYAENSDYLVTHHIPIVLDMILYFISCSVIVSYVYLLSLIKITDTWKTIVATD